MTPIFVALAASIIRVWSLMGMLRHSLNEIAKASSIIAKLRPSEKRRSFINMLCHPSLPLSKEAADLPERKSMMSSYWKSGLYGVAFLISANIFTTVYQSAFG